MDKTEVNIITALAHAIGVEVVEIDSWSFKIIVNKKQIEISTREDSGLQYSIYNQEV